MGFQFQFISFSKGSPIFSDAPPRLFASSHPRKLHASSLRVKGWTSKKKKRDLLMSIEKIQTKQQKMQRNKKNMHTTWGSCCKIQGHNTFFPFADLAPKSGPSVAKTLRKRTRSTWGSSGETYQVCPKRSSRSGLEEKLPREKYEQYQGCFETTKNM